MHLLLRNTLVASFFMLGLVPGAIALAVTTFGLALVALLGQGGSIGGDGIILTIVVMMVLSLCALIVTLAGGAAATGAMLATRHVRAESASAANAEATIARAGFGAFIGGGSVATLGILLLLSWMMMAAGSPGFELVVTLIALLVPATAAMCWWQFRVLTRRFLARDAQSSGSGRRK